MYFPPQTDPANPPMSSISAAAAQGQPGPVVAEVSSIMLNVVTSAGKSIKVETTTSDCVLDIRQFLSDMPETCYLTCYHLACKGTKLNDFAELGEYPMFQEAPSAVHTLEMEEDFYDERAARLHVRRLREVLVEPPTHLMPPAPDAYHAVGSAAHVSLSGDESKERAKKNADAAVAAFGTDDRSAVDEFSLPAFHQAAAKEKVPECVKNITFSPWNPPPGNRRLRGDLLYLEILTLENHTLHITASVDGFFVNNSTREAFDPSAAAPSYKAHTLVDLLRRASPLFGSRFQQLLSRKSVRHPFESVPVPSPVYDWLAPASATHTFDWNRAEDALLSTFGMDARGVLRDWNEEYQSCRDLPAASGPDRVIRERTIYRVYADFVGAAIKGAQAIVHGNIPPINPGEPERTHVFLYNNIFFSYAIDGRGLYKDMGISGDMVAYSVANHDLMGVKAYSEIDLPKLHVLAHCVVNYRGHRVVCQSVIAGIFHDQTSEHLYGSMDNGRTLKCDPAFHALMLEAGQKLHIAEHPVFDDSGNKALICSAYESKGMSGSDRRKYILDVTRAFPRDANFPNAKQHPTALIRPELLRQYCRSKAFQKAIDKNQKNNASEEKAPNSVYEHAVYLEQLGALRFNPDAFTVNHTLKRRPLVGVDPKEVPPTDRELDDEYYASAEGQQERKHFEREEEEVKDIANYINNNVLPALVNDFNQATEVPLDSVSLTKMMHDRGLNMRYLGRVNGFCVKYGIGYLEELCTEEMVVRAAKHLLHEHMRQVKPAAGQRDENSFLAPAVAFFLNSLLGRNSCGMGLSEEELAAAKKVMAAEKQRKKDEDDSGEREVGGRLTKKLAARKKKEKAAVIRLSDNSKAPVDPAAPANLWTRVRELVLLKYEHELPAALELTARRKLRMLRSLCGKVGIQLACREYRLDELPSKEREKDPIFTADDILDLYPVVKTNSPRSRDACDLVESGKAALSQGNLPFAYHYLTEALNLFHQIVGPMHKDSADTCSTLAMVCYHAHDYAQAVEYQQKALLIYERVLGMDHPETASAHSSLALLLHSAGFTDAALKHIKRALFLFELISGPNHPDTAATHMNLAVLLQDSGRMYLGLAHLDEALRRFRASLGEHPHTAAAHHALAISCSLLGRYDDAVNHEKKAKTIYSAKFGDAHPRVQESKAWYAQFTTCAVQVRQGKASIPNFQGLSAPFSWMSLRSIVPFRGRLTMGDVLQLVETAARSADDKEKALQQQQELEQQQERLLSSLGMTREEMEAAMALGPRPPKPKKAPAPPTVQPVQPVADANGAKGADNKSKNKKRRDKKKADKKAPAPTLFPAQSASATPAPVPAAADAQ